MTTASGYGGPVGDEREPDIVRSGGSAAWFALGLAVLGVLVISAFAWLDHNPGAIDWDNA